MFRYGRKRDAATVETEKWLRDNGFTIGGYSGYGKLNSISIMSKANHWINRTIYVMRDKDDRHAYLMLVKRYMAALEKIEELRRENKKLKEKGGI